MLLLDEPLSGLDIKASENLLTVFRQIVDQPDHQVSLIMVEHDVAAVLALSDIVFVLDFGERIAVGTAGGRSATTPPCEPPTSGTPIRRMINRDRPRRTGRPAAGGPA